MTIARSDEQMELYDRTVARLKRGGVNDPTAQIIALAEENESYRKRLQWQPPAPPPLTTIKNYPLQDLIVIAEKLAQQGIKPEAVASIFEMHSGYNAILLLVENRDKEAKE